MIGFGMKEPSFGPEADTLRHSEKGHYLFCALHMGATFPMAR